MRTTADALGRMLAATLLAVTAATAVAGQFDLAFGSCLRQWQPQPVWDGVLASEPDLFVMLGDNVYTDTGPYRFRQEPRRLSEAYTELDQNTDFARLRAQVPILATWDDHDYGLNDGGADYRYRREAKQAFVDFFDVPEESPLRDRDGIYRAEMIDTPAGHLQLLLLDTRSFRSPLRFGLPNLACPRLPILPNREPGATMLGDAQWAWLEQQLGEPADLRIIASSIQVIPDAHCFEKWANFPDERERLLGLIDQAPGRTIILSGDRHHGDISRIEREGQTPIYEVTASGLNSARRGPTEPNRYRVLEDNVRADHFGLLRLSESDDELRIRLELRDVDGVVIDAVQIGD